MEPTKDRQRFALTLAAFLDLTPFFIAMIECDNSDNLPPISCKRISSLAQALQRGANSSGRWCYGKTPMQAFIDSIPLAKEKDAGSVSGGIINN